MRLPPVIEDLGDATWRRAWADVACRWTFDCGTVRRRGVVVGVHLAHPGMEDGRSEVSRSTCGRKLLPYAGWSPWPRRRHHYPHVRESLRFLLALVEDGTSFEGVVRDRLTRHGHGKHAARLAARTAAMARAAASDFLDTLDPAMLAVVRLRQAEDVEPEEMDRTLGGEPRLAATALAYPTIRGLLYDRWLRCIDDLPTDPSREDEWDAVARRALAETTDCPGWMLARVPDLNRMSKLHRPHGFPCDDGTLLAEVRDLVRLPPSWTPRTPLGWQEYVRARPVVRAAGALLADGDDLAALLSSKGRWGLWTDALRRHGNPAGAVPSAQAGAFGTQVLGPFASAYMPEHRRMAMAVDIMWSGSSLPAIMGWVARWRVARPAIASRIAALNAHLPRPGEGWPAGLPDHHEGDVWIHVLTTPGELLAEGASEPRDGRAGLSHCVGGYSGVCRDGGVRIVSVRRMLGDGDWERLSTASVRALPGRFVVDEHHGRWDLWPSSRASAAVSAYVAMLCDGRLPVDRAALMPVPEPPAEGTYDWAVDGAWESVFEAWGTCLPGRIARLGRDGFGDLARKVIVANSGWHKRHILDGR